MPTKNKPSSPPQRYFLLIFIFLLTACGTVPAEKVTTPTSTSAATFTPVSTATLVDVPPIPASSATPTLTPSQTPTPSLTPLPATLPTFPLDGYVMLFTKDGNLYFQDGENTPIQLSHSEKETSYSPKLSDNNQKVVFSQDDGSVHSINTDGTQERVILQQDWLHTFETGTQMGELNFIPNTHLLLVEAYLCASEEFRSPCSISIFIADTDTSEIRKLANLGLTRQQNSMPRSIKISPDGQMIAVGNLDGLSILTLDGNIIRQNVLPYESYDSTVLFPSLFWLPDSSGLIVIVPDSDTFVAGFDVPAYSVWRYDIDTVTATQIPLTPSLVYIPGGYVCGGYNVSLDRKWILYLGSEDYTRSISGDGDYALYIGNLHTGQAQRYDIRFCAKYSWSPDSEHFLYGNILSAMGKPSIEIWTPNTIGWVDDFHFLIPDDNPKPSEEINILVAEIRGDTIVFFDLGIRLGDLVTIKLKR